MVDPDQNFTPQEKIRDIQQLFAGNDLQLDPQGMIDFMIETIPQDNHKFRNVYPQRFIENVKKYQESLWDIEVYSGFHINKPQ
ncbi:MAG: hypothetical protein AAGJ08_01900 [Cyanobacteria bacterium P01_H01_bin.35]